MLFVPNAKINPGHLNFVRIFKSVASIWLGLNRTSVGYFNFLLEDKMLKNILFLWIPGFSCFGGVWVYAIHFCYGCDSLCNRQLSADIKMKNYKNKT